MATYYKVLDVDGSSLFVKYTHEDGRKMRLDLTWDGVTPVDQFIASFNPFPRPATPPPYAEQYVGYEGTCIQPGGVPQNGGSPQAGGIESAPPDDQAGRQEESQYERARAESEQAGEPTVSGRYTASPADSTRGRRS